MRERERKRDKLIPCAIVLSPHTHTNTYQYVMAPVSIAPRGPHNEMTDGASQLQIANAA